MSQTNCTLNNAGLFQPKCGSNIDKPNWVNILNYMFNPTFGFVHILPKFELKQPSIFLFIFFLVLDGGRFLGLISIWVSFDFFKLWVNGCALHMAPPTEGDLLVNFLGHWSLHGSKIPEVSYPGTFRLWTMRIWI